MKRRHRDQGNSSTEITGPQTDLGRYASTKEIQGIEEVELIRKFKHSRSSSGNSKLKHDLTSMDAWAKTDGLGGWEKKKKKTRVTPEKIAEAGQGARSFEKIEAGSGIERIMKQGGGSASEKGFRQASPEVRVKKRQLDGIDGALPPRRGNFCGPNIMRPMEGTQPRRSTII